MLSSFNLQPNSELGLCLAIILLSGFLLTRVTKLLKLPNVTAYILTGVLLGPFCFNVIPTEIINSLGFVTDVALGFIAFGVGRYFLFHELKRNGINILILTCCEALIAAVVIIFVMLVIFRQPLAFALLLGAIGSATAPASTIMTIRQYQAKGDFVNLILQVVALDDAVSILAFSVCAAIAEALVQHSAMNLMVFIEPVLTNGLAVAMGIGCGLIMHKMITEKRSDDNRLIIAVSMILIMSALCTALDVSPLLCCMAMGAAYLNLSKDIQLFDQGQQLHPADHDDLLRRQRHESEYSGTALCRLDRSGVLLLPHCRQADRFVDRLFPDPGAGHNAKNFRSGTGAVSPASRLV